MESYLKTFHDREEGAVLILFAAFLLPMLVISGMAIELTRQAYIQTQLAYACDAGAMAAARYNTVDAQKNGLNFFNANFLPNNVGGISAVPVFTISSDTNFVSCSVKSSMPTYISPVAGILKINLDSITEVQRIVAPTEVSLVLDNTGSMASNSKIQGLITAANQLITTLYQGKTSDPRIATAIVPYVASVNVGNSHASWLTNPADAKDLTKFPAKAPWEGCVMAADTGLTLATDAPPSATRKWPIYYVPSTSAISGNSDNNYSISGGSITTKNPPVKTVGPNRSCGLPIQPLTNLVAPLTALINKMVPVDGGGTFGDLGLGWGWNAISPKWAGLWGGVDPQAYGKVAKSIVIVTDGENQWFNDGASPTGDPTAYATVYDPKTLSRISYGTLGAPKAGICKSPTCRSQIDERMLDLCAKIKATGTQIFTVTFRVSDALAIQNYRTCATKPEWAFQAGDNTQLLSNFKTIGEQLLNIRISK